jgi:hypothetical protein
MRRVQALQFGGRQVVGDHVHGRDLAESAGPDALSFPQDMIKRGRVQEI